MKQIVFIVNPVAGGHSKERILESIGQHMDAGRFTTRVIISRKPGDIRSICTDELKKGSDILVAVGGDGTVNEVASSVSGKNAIMGVLPSGSGNGLARHLGIPLRMEKAMHCLNSGNIRTIDTGRINGRLFVNVAGVGFDGKMAKKFEAQSERGFLGYLRSFISEYPKYKPKKYILEVNGRRTVTRALLITFANSDQFGFNTSIAPSADISDGLMDICIVQKPSVIELPFIAGMLFWKRADRLPHIETIRAASARVYTPKNRYCNVDGEAVRLGNILDVRIIPQSLRMIVPSGED